MCAEGLGVTLAGAAFGEDLGSSSKHSAEKPKDNSEDRCGGGFLVNCV